MASSSQVTSDTPSTASSLSLKPSASGILISFIMTRAFVILPLNSSSITSVASIDGVFSGIYSTISCWTGTPNCTTALMIDRTKNVMTINFLLFKMPAVISIGVHPLLHLPFQYYNIIYDIVLVLQQTVL